MPLFLSFLNLEIAKNLIKQNNKRNRIKKCVHLFRDQLEDIHNTLNVLLSLHQT